MRAKKYENGGPSKKGDPVRKDPSAGYGEQKLTAEEANMLATGNVPFSMLSRERQAYKKRRAEAGNAAWDRAMREMGYEGGPITPLLEKLGMTENEFYDKVYEIYDEVMVEPLEIRGPERVDSGYSRPQMRGEGERTMAREARGGMGASATEDLLERLSQYKRNAYGNKYEQGGMVAKKKGSTIKIAGQYAVDSIKTTPEGNQYVSMELPDGKVVPVFGDWETYGNPDQEGRIEDLDFRIYPLGDGTYALDAAEAEADMLRYEARGVAREAGPNVEDLLQELNQRGGMGFTPSGRMRPVKRQ